MEGQVLLWPGGEAPNVADDPDAGTGGTGTDGGDNGGPGGEDPLESGKGRGGPPQQLDRRGSFIRDEWALV